jgi:phosphatidate cytidylyltransferase
MNNFIKRTLTGFVYVAVVVLSLITHPVVFAVLTSFLNFSGLYEFRRMDKNLSKFSPVWIYVNAFLFLIAALLTVFCSGMMYSLASILIIILYNLIHSLYIKDKENGEFMARSVFATIYVTLPLLLLNIIHGNPMLPGISIVLTLFILIWINDSFAYIFGLLLGKHRLFERISPKKSWEGFIGGFIMTLVASYILNLIYPSPGLIYWMIFGILTVLAGVYGDFIESMLKRSANVKDSGSLLPGHGGILDRIDSILLASPVIYIFLLILNNL